ncbi:MAG: hypothetical protein A2X94_02215 [Bdellovibrionales bacterium GWB1_55_8]|nr:MAG: hypothetical protein A2X94_02215 [Bdellovibrionales bacterium GWB1_55_8]
MELRTLILLLVCNLIWSANPVLSKFLLRDFSAPDAAWLRYGSAFGSYLVFIMFRGRFAHAFAMPAKVKDWLLIAVLGFFAFCVSPLANMGGLQVSRAMDGALITAMEPMLAILLAWMLLRERVGSHQLIALGFALLGFSLLADITLSRILSLDLSGHTVGNLILLISITGEAVYSVLGKKLMIRHEPMPVFGSALGIGMLLLTLSNAFFAGAALPQFSSFTWSSFFAVLWLGPLGTMVSYLYWMTALKRAPVAAVVITLFVQPVFGSLLGALLLGERLSAVQAFGALLILTAVFGRSLVALFRGRAERTGGEESTVPDVAAQ